MASPIVLLSALAASSPLRGADEPEGKLATEPRPAAFLSRPDLTDTEVREFVQRAGGTPILEGDRAIFLVEAAAGVRPRVVGDFNDWGDGPAGPEMEALGSTGFHVMRVLLDPRARVEYLVVRGEAEQALDPLNPRSVAAFTGRHSEVRMPGYRTPDGLRGGTVPRRGRVESFSHESPSLRDVRRVHVYLPPGYDDERKRVYPVAWLHDGTAYLEGVGVPGIADALVAGGSIEPLIIVFVDPVVRRTEYSGNAGFRAMFTDELLPSIDRRYRTDARAERRAVGGGSRGGLAALDLALARPDLFGLCAAWAPAIAPAAVPVFLGGRTPRGLFVLTRHLYDAEWGEDASALRDGLGAAEVVYQEIPEGHTLAAWPGRVADALVRLFPPPARERIPSGTP